MASLDSTINNNEYHALDTSEAQHDDSETLMESNAIEAEYNECLASMGLNITSNFDEYAVPCHTDTTSQLEKDFVKQLRHMEYIERISTYEFKTCYCCPGSVFCMQKQRAQIRRLESLLRGHTQEEEVEHQSKRFYVAVEEASLFGKCTIVVSPGDHDLIVKHDAYERYGLLPADSLPVAARTVSNKHYLLTVNSPLHVVWLKSFVAHIEESDGGYRFPIYLYHFERETPFPYMAFNTIHNYEVERKQIRFCRVLHIGCCASNRVNRCDCKVQLYRGFENRGTSKKTRKRTEPIQSKTLGLSRSLAYNPTVSDWRGVGDKIMYKKNTPHFDINYSVPNQYGNFDSVHFCNLPV